MRYTHHLRVIRRRKHALPISLVVIGLILVLIFTYGFNQLDAVQFLSGFLYSFFRIIISYVIALALAISISLFVLQNKKTEDISLPILDVLQSFPTFSIMPLLLAYFGR